MFDLLLERLYLVVLLVPIVVALGSAAVKWWREAGQRSAASPDQAEEGTARVEAVGLFPDGANHRLRLTNEGAAPARNVHVFLNNKPITAHRGGASAEPHPLSELGPGQSFSYRYASGWSTGDDEVLVRIEWEDRFGGGMERAILRVP